MRRNGTAVGEIARLCVRAGTSLLLVSTNEVFDGERTDGRGYVESDPVAPRNAYGASKLRGELEAQRAMGAGDGLWIIRTAWLFGPPGNDFPARIVAAADRLPEGEPLPVVSDEVGSPTYTVDLARACLALVRGTAGGTFHLVNAGAASRLEWAVRVLAHRRPGRAVRPIGRAEFTRRSDPPAWGVLDAGRAAAAGVVLRPWQDAVTASLAAVG
jgi:dTDP-4-dehydrorhamnose reductase